MMKKEAKTRILHVNYKSQYPNYKTIPAINLCGDWLSKMGFEIGDRIVVYCKNGSLTIRKENI